MHPPAHKTQPIISSPTRHVDKRRPLLLPTPPVLPTPCSKGLSEVWPSLGLPFYLGPGGAQPPRSN